MNKKNPNHGGDGRVGRRATPAAAPTPYISEIDIKRIAALVVDRLTPAPAEIFTPQLVQRDAPQVRPDPVVSAHLSTLGGQRERLEIAVTRYEALVTTAVGEERCGESSSKDNAARPIGSLREELEVARGGFDSLLSRLEAANDRMRAFI